VVVLVRIVEAVVDDDDAAQVVVQHARGRGQAPRVAELEQEVRLGGASLGRLRHGDPHRRVVKRRGELQGQRGALFNC